MSTILYLDSVEAPLEHRVAELVSLGTLLGDLMVVSATTPTPQALEAIGETGVTHVIAADHDLSGSAVVEQAALLTAAIDELEPRVVISPNAPEETEVLARVAATKEAAIITSVQTLAPDLSATKPVLSGTGYSVVRPTTGLAFVTVLPGAATAAPVTGAPAAELYPLPISAAGAAATITSRVSADVGDRPALEDAATVVAGGRGTDGDFSAVEQLADALGGAVGASRVAADEGWIGHEAQVGQTGRSVAPDLYVAAGISGAVQHVVGLRQAGTIVAVNTDEDAPIFDIADLGIVGKLQDVLPQAAEEILQRR